MFIHQNPDDGEIRLLLQRVKTIAVVGLSDKLHRDSYRVAEYMQQKGYRIIPVNPRAKTILGEVVYKSMQLIPEKVDLVNIFRRSELVAPLMEEALSLKPQAVWLQLGIVNEQAARSGKTTGSLVVMDKCIKTEHLRLFRHNDA